jgi:hypothetical protein
MTLDQLINGCGGMPEEPASADKALAEQVRLIAELEADERSMVFKLVDAFLSKKRFREFVQKNIAAL